MSGSKETRRSNGTQADSLAGAKNKKRDGPKRSKKRWSCATGAKNKKGKAPKRAKSTETRRAPSPASAMLRGGRPRQPHREVNGHYPPIGANGSGN